MIIPIYFFVGALVAVLLILAMKPPITDSDHDLIAICMLLWPGLVAMAVAATAIVLLLNFARWLRGLGS